MLIPQPAQNSFCSLLVTAAPGSEELGLLLLSFLVAALHMLGNVL